MSDSIKPRPILDAEVEAKDRADLETLISMALIMHGARVTRGTYRIRVERVGPVAS